MSNSRSKAPYYAAALAGAAHAFAAVFLWTFLAVSNPIIDWLLDSLARKGHEVTYRLAIYSHDLIVNVMLALPFAVFIAFLTPRRSWSYLWVALTVSVCLLNWSLLLDPGHFAIVLGLPSFYLGTLVMVLSLPLAFAAVIASGRISNAA